MVVVDGQYQAPAALSPGQGHVTHCRVCWVGPGPFWTAMKEEKIPCRHRASKPWSSSS